MSNFVFTTKAKSTVVSIDGGNQIVVNQHYIPLVIMPENKILQMNASSVLTMKQSNRLFMNIPSINVDEDSVIIDGVTSTATTAQALFDEIESIFFLGNLSTEEISGSSAGIEFTGGFAGKPSSNGYDWVNGTGINITQQDVASERFKTFSLDSTIQAIVDVPYWSDPTPASHTGKGVFGGSYLPDGVSNVFDYTTVDSDTYADGSNIVTTGGLDFSQLQVGDKVDVRFDFNAIPQIANTTIEPAIWYKNRDANDNVTATFPLTAQPIFYGTGTVGKTYLNRVSLTIYIASQEDINSLSHFAIKSDNLIVIQPITALFTLIR